MLATLAVAAVSTPPATAQDDPGRLLRELRAGDRDCQDVDAEDFVAIGEQVMGRQFPSAQAHEAMDQLMRAMMGDGAERQMHEFLGRRAAGCGGTLPSSFGPMMSMMGSLGSGSMMGGQGYGPIDRRSMMGTGFVARDEGDDGDAAAIVMAALMALLVVVVVVALWRLRPRGVTRADLPLDVLQRRYAAGEIDTDEYERRSAALGGAT